MTTEPEPQPTTTPPQPSPPPTMMRAWTHTRAGLPSKVLSLTSVPAPTLKIPTSVLVKISHAGLNPGCSMMMQLVPFLFRTSPAIPGLDFSGTVVATGADVPEARGLKPGTPVFGSILLSPHFKGAGALAEMVVVDASTVVRKPENATFAEAAGIAVAGTTAIALLESAEIKKGDRVLINGASGGIGSMFVQLARDAVGKEGKVVAVCSRKNAEFVKELGADEVVDYQAHAPVHKYLAATYSTQPFDAVIDAFGIQDFYTYCADYLAPGKPFVSVGVAFQSYSYISVLYSVYQILKNNVQPRFLGGPDRKCIYVRGFANLEAMEKLGKLVEEGKMKIPLDSVWEMEDVLGAYEKMLSKRAAGKIVVKVQDL